MVENRLRHALHTRIFGRNLLYLERTGSTNTVAMAAAAGGAPEGTVIVAGEQTAGRGRLGRKWVAPAGLCLLCSVLFRPFLDVAHANLVTMLCALAAADAVQATSGVMVGLKWPNDLVVASAARRSPEVPWRKLAGLLTETGLRANRVEYAVVGIGINVNVPPALLSSLAPGATSLLAEIGRPVDMPCLCATLLGEIERRYGELGAGMLPLAEWASRLVTLGRPVKAATVRGGVIGVGEGVDERGSLLVRTADGVLRTLTAADVTLREVPSVR